MNDLSTALRRAALLLAALALGACAWLNPLQAPTVDVTGLYPLPPVAGEQRVRVNLRLQNPNDRELKLKGLQFALALRGNDVLSGVSNQHTVLPALGEARMQVDVSLSLLGGLGLFRELLASPVEPLDYALKGRLYLDEPLMPDVRINRKGALDMPRR